jgi:alpha-D-xyloside xylohydrolase
MADLTFRYNNRSLATVASNETGKYATIPFTWNDAAGKLTIGARNGSFTGMLASRTFNVVFVGADHGTGSDATATADQTVKYDGTETSAAAK